MSLTAPKKITLKDIAHKAGVSATAVSHVLNDRLGHVRVSDAKRRRIHEVAKTLEYVPQLRGRSMVNQKSYALAAVCSFGEAEAEIGPTLYFAEALRGIEEICRLVDYNCLFVSCPLYDLEQFERPRLMRDGSVDGAILVGYTCPAVAQRIGAMGLHCVQVGSNVAPASGIDCVEPDLDTAFEEMAARLYDRGHRWIELLLPLGPGPEKLASHFRRVGERYRNLKTTAVMGPSLFSGPQEGREHARRWLGQKDRPTAFICNSRQGRGLANELADAGLDYPKDYSLIMFGDTRTAEMNWGPDHVAPALIEIPVRDVARQASARLLEKLDIKTDGLPRWQAKLPCGFQDGPSWGPPPQRETF